MAALLEEYPDEDWIGSLLADKPDDAEPEPWHSLYFRAFDALRFDRQYGAFGGETPISYLALSRYAEIEGVPSTDWPLFHRFMVALDVEWLTIQDERRKATASASRPPMQ